MIHSEKNGLFLPTSVETFEPGSHTTDPEEVGLALPVSPVEELQSGPHIEVVERKLELLPNPDISTSESSILPQAPFRDEQTQKLYRDHAERKHQRGETGCDICRLVDEHFNEQKGMRGSKFGRAIAELANTGFIIVPNGFPYDTVDGQKVKKHDLLVPVKHFSEKDKVPVRTRFAHARKLAQAMRKYDLYSERSPGNIASSIPGHKHGHLYELGSKMNFFMYDPANNRREIRFHDDDLAQPDA
jgi:hypothetical protein